VQLRCATCGHCNEFDQPYAYHAGFGDQGFLYNDAGDCTLVWNINDPAYEAVLTRYAPEQPWELTPEAKRSYRFRRAVTTGALTILRAAAAARTRLCSQWARRRSTICSIPRASFSLAVRSRVRSRPTSRMLQMPSGRFA